MTKYKRELWIKENLPMVRVRYEDQLYLAQIKGRKNNYATVVLHRPYTQENPGKLGEVMDHNQHSFDFSWESLVEHFDQQRKCLVV